MSRYLVGIFWTYPLNLHEFLPKPKLEDLNCIGINAPLEITSKPKGSCPRIKQEHMFDGFRFFSTNGADIYKLPPEKIFKSWQSILANAPH